MRDAPSPSASTSGLAGLDDARLIPLIQGGDLVAYRYLCEVALPILLQFAYHIIRTREAAEDAVLEVLGDIWIARAQFNPRGPLRAYLYRCVRNSLLNTMTHERVVERAEEAMDLDEPYGMGSAPVPVDSVVERSDLVETVAAAVGELPERQRTAVVLRWYEGMTTAEVAHVMEISRQGAEKLLQKGEARLQLLLREVRRE